MGGLQLVVIASITLDAKSPVGVASTKLIISHKLSNPVVWSTGFKRLIMRYFLFSANEISLLDFKKDWNRINSASEIVILCKIIPLILITLEGNRRRSSPPP